MRKIESTDQEQILLIINQIAKIRGEVEQLDKSMRLLMDKQASLLTELENHRDADRALSNYLVEKYGAGKLDFGSMQWIEKNQ